MTFIRTIPVAEATGEARALYDAFHDSAGQVPNYIKPFGLRPAIYAAYEELIGAIRGNMDLRRYELVTVAAALALESSYCALSHGKVLSEKILGPAQTEAFARDFRQAELTPPEEAMVAYARKLAVRAGDVTQADIDELRRHGFSDAEIFDIALAATARCFFSKLLDGIGALPDPSYAEMTAGLRNALALGREIAKSPSP